MVKIIEIFSAILTPVIAICTGIFMWKQTVIQQQQQQTELFKLRNEHIKTLFEVWGSFQYYIKYIKGYIAQVVAVNNNQEEIISHMQNAVRQLTEHNFSTQVLFGKELYVIENNLIREMGQFIPINNGTWTIQNLPLEKYEQNREHFNNLYEKYTNLMNRESKICK